MICMIVLQNGMDFEEETYIESCVTRDDDGSEEVTINFEDAVDIKKEVTIKIEDAIDIKDEFPEDIPNPPIETEKEVRFCGVCEGVAGYSLNAIVAPRRKWWNDS